MRWRTYALANVALTAVASLAFLGFWVQGGEVAYAIIFAAYATAAFAWFELVDP